MAPAIAPSDSRLGTLNDAIAAGLTWGATLRARGSRAATPMTVTTKSPRWMRAWRPPSASTAPSGAKMVQGRA